MIVACKKWNNPYPVSECFTDEKAAARWLLKQLKNGHQFLSNKAVEGRIIITILKRP